MNADLVMTSAAVLSACILLIVLAVQIQIKLLSNKVDQILSKLGDS